MFGAVAWATSVGVLAYTLGSVVRHLVLDVAVVTAVLAPGLRAAAAGRKAFAQSRVWSRSGASGPHGASFAIGVALAALLTVALRAPFFTSPSAWTRAA